MKAQGRWGEGALEVGRCFDVMMRRCDDEFAASPHGKVERKARSILDDSVFRAVNQSKVYVHAFACMYHSMARARVKGCHAT